MFKYKSRNTNGSNSREKKIPPRPKPDFTTDFVDREKYKLSQAEMIQKKAALQSKHRQQAIQELQQRRKKLQQGIIDDDTRRVYQTALSSKNIDINPSIRKNLSQMIKYEKQKQEERSNSRSRHRTTQSRQLLDHNQAESEEDNEEIQKQLKETKNFIKKFERVKKMDNIERAVGMLTQTHQPPKKQYNRSKDKQKTTQKICPLYNERLVSNMKESKDSKSSCQQEALSSIQDTIRFMEQRLFSAKRIERIKEQQIQKVMNQTPSQSFYSLQGQNKEMNIRENLELSELGYHESQGEQQCLQTIRRMKQMMQNQPKIQRLKQNREGINNNSSRFAQFSTMRKQSPHIAQSEAEVDFSLTVNESQMHSLQESKVQHQQTHNDRQYQRLKKSLFQEVNRLQLHTPEVSMEHSFQAKTSLPIDQSSITNLRCVPTPTPKTRKINPQIAKLRNQIDGVKESVESIKVQPMNIVQSGGIMGVDFRGSINIKKHIVQK